MIPGAFALLKSDLVNPINCHSSTGCNILKTCFPSISVITLTRDIAPVAVIVGEIESFENAHASEAKLV